MTEAVRANVDLLVVCVTGKLPPLLQLKDDRVVEHHYDLLTLSLARSCLVLPIQVSN